MIHKPHVSSVKLLNSALHRQLEKNPSFSMRAIAKKINISQSFLVGIFQGKKKVPLNRIKQISSALGMDDSSQKNLRLALAAESLLQNKELSLLYEEYFTDAKRGLESSVAKREESAINTFSALDPWYTISILDLVTCANFKADFYWIGEQLSIEPQQAKNAFLNLEKNGLIKNKDGVWIKTKKQLRFPTTKSHPSIRNYHKKMIEKSLTHLLTKTDELSFESRLITSISIASNPENLKKAKIHLTEALYETADILLEGSCTEIYQLNAQLFPLSKK